MSVIDTMKDQLRCRAFDGALTERLVQEPAAHGLGRVPKTVKPDATVDSICGFCCTPSSPRSRGFVARAVESSGANAPPPFGQAMPRLTG